MSEGKKWDPDLADPWIVRSYGDPAAVVSYRRDGCGYDEEVRPRESESVSGVGWTGTLMRTMRRNES